MTDSLQLTHHADCYRYHHECAVAEVERLREQIRIAREYLRQEAWWSAGEALKPLEIEP